MNATDTRIVSTGWFPRLVDNWGWILVLAYWSIVTVLNAVNLAPRVRYLRFSGVDFDQYYAAGVVVAEGLWDHMYADMSALLLGQGPEMGTYPEELTQELDRRKAQYFVKNINPPFSAFLFYPLSWFNYLTAKRAFIVFFAGVLFLFLYCLHRECSDVGISPFWTNLIILLAGTGIPVSESVLMQNMSLVTGFSTLLVLRGMRNQRTMETILGFAAAGLTKGFSAAWVPALFVWKQWRIVSIGAILALFFVIFPLICGANVQTFQEYFRNVYPASRKLYYINEGNLCIPSFLCWIMNWPKLPSVAESLLNGCQVLLYCFIYGMGIKASRRSPALAQGLCLLASTLVFQIFSPVCWTHYAVNILPFLPMAIAATYLMHPFGEHGLPFLPTKHLHDKRRIVRQVLSLSVLLVGFVLAWYPVGNAAKYITGLQTLGYGRLFGYLVLLFWSFVELALISCHNAPSFLNPKRTKEDKRGTTSGQSMPNLA